jgi:WD40 repeat protein
VIVSGSADQTIGVWQLADGTRVAEPLGGHDGRVEAVAVGASRERSVVASGSRERTVRVWDLAHATTRREPPVGVRLRRDGA